MAAVEPLTTISRPVDDLSAWLSDANKAVHIKLGKFHSLENDQGFHPEFTYPIFGQEERIFGYKNLTINLYYAAGSLHTYLDIHYGKKIQTSAVQPAYADDALRTLREHLPKGLANNLDEFMRRVEVDEAAFTPYGRKMYQYRGRKDDSRVFEIWHATFADRGFIDYHDRMKIFAIFYIEGASNIEPDERWEVFVTYEKRNEGGRESYTFVGYSTCYPFFCYPDSVRMRISQFVVLPLYQGQGHGGALYDFLYREFWSRNKTVDFGSVESWGQLPVKEITVEDPNETFQIMRDRRDVRLAEREKIFEKLYPPTTMDSVLQLSRKYKLNKKQGYRTYELYMYSHVPRSDTNLYSAYRRHIKKRLYLQNLDQLLAASPDDIKKKLHDGFQNLIIEYRQQLDPNTWRPTPAA
ncbi:hypothetical protein SeLEV6574_g03462 [Synchytrium endobioticum]|uniref:Histone acetyltransferase type B catalytic subunit n=1 Tax=Synchytrium endobioticum TaxID=286115 RepID=A0A507D3N4_9FUNG|nr:hypothetical protein SeLEV6574_g03462 [Synchytrium endobioticum]